MPEAAWLSGLFIGASNAIASYHRHGRTYVVTANEGDARDYGGSAKRCAYPLPDQPVAFRHH